MDGGNWRPAQQEGAETDWRSQLSHDSRNRIVNKILDTLKKHLPISGPDGLGELQKIAVRFEEKIYAAATSQTDYLRRISVKMLTMETKSQSGVANSSSMGGQNPSDPGSNSMQSQIRNQGQQQLPMTMINPLQTHPQMLPQNSITSAAVQNSASLSATMSSMTGLTQNGMTNVAGQNANLSSNMGGVPQNSNSNSLVGQGVQPNAFANAQRQQQLQGSQQQSQNSQQQYSIYQQQQQLRNQLLKQKIQQQQQQQQSQQLQGNMQSSMLHTHLQQQQQQQSSLLQSNQLQGSQQSLMQMASGHQSTQPLQQPSPSMMQTVPQSGLQQNQQPQSVLHQHQQSFMRQQQQSQQSSAHHQQQSQLIGQQPNTHGIQQMLGQQQTGVQDMQQQQQQRLLGSPGNLNNIQQPLQPSIHGQQSSISTLNQQQQLSGQNNLAGGQQQQQLTHQGNLSNIQLHQNSMHMMQQAKSAGSQQQSNQQAPSAVLPSQVQQQSQAHSHQQQLMSQLQSQSLQLPQQMALQQQQPQANSIAMQPRMQAQSNLLQTQNNIDQQKQLLFHAQRGLPEASSTSLDSTAQTGLPPDWQEEAYQKLKTMKEMYYTDLSDLLNKITSRCQQYDVPQGKQIDQNQIDKLKLFRNMLERLVHCLNFTKSSILPGFKDKLPVYEKQIINVLTSNRIKKPPLLQQGPQPNSPGVTPLSSMPQQPMVQMSQLQQHDNLVNQMQPMSMQSSATTSMSMPLTTNVSAPHAQQGMLNSIQPAQNLDQTHGNAMSSSQQNVMVSLQQNSLMGAQQSGMSTIPQGVNLLQPNVNNLQSNPNMIQHQQLKQQQDQHKQQQLMQNQQLKQQFSQRHMHSQIMQHQQKHILMQQQLQQQQLIQPAQPKQQMPQVHQMNNDVNEMKIRPASGLVKSGMFPQQHQRPPSYQQPLKNGGSFPVSSPQLLQSHSPQISQQPSPQIDPQNFHGTIPKTGTPLQSASSPFAPSPSTPFTVPSPIPGEQEKPTPGISSVNAGNVVSQQVPPALSQANTLAIGTPGMSASPLLAEFTGADGSQVHAAVAGKASATERPLDRLLKSIKSMSPEAFSSAVSDIRSVVSMVDRIAGSAPGNGSRAAVGEDLVAMTKCRLQARTFTQPDGSSTTVTKKMKRETSAMPLNAVSSAGSVNNDNFRLLTSLEASDLESTATSRIKMHKVEANHSLIEEIKDINLRLLDTVVEICDEDVDSVAGAAEGEGTIVKCSYTAVAISPHLKSQFAAAQMSPIIPLRLLVPNNYPSCSPILLDKCPAETCKEDDLSARAKSRFSISLRGLPHPMSLGEIARTWDACARQVIAEYAQQSGGGTFSSRYGTWDNCVSA